MVGAGGEAAGVEGGCGSKGKVGEFDDAAAVGFLAELGAGGDGGEGGAVDGEIEMTAIGGDGDIADAARARKIGEGVADDVVAVSAELEADQPMRFERRHQQRVLPAGYRIGGVDGEATGRLRWPMPFVTGSTIVDE